MSSLPTCNSVIMGKNVYQADAGAMLGDLFYGSLGTLLNVPVAIALGIATYSNYKQDNNFKVSTGALLFFTLLFTYWAISSMLKLGDIKNTYTEKCVTRA